MDEAGPRGPKEVHKQIHSIEVKTVCHSLDIQTPPEKVFGPKKYTLNRSK